MACTADPDFIEWVTPIAVDGLEISDAAKVQSHVISSSRE
jgi:hypothetical protein